MTTEHGVPTPRAAGRYVDVIRDRHDYLAGLADAGEANGWQVQELAALQWALPVLEAEQGTVIRLWRDVLNPADALLRHDMTRAMLAEFGRHHYADDPADADRPAMKRSCGVCGVQRSRHPGARQVRDEVDA